MDKDGKMTFFNLPGEIRNMIYAQAREVDLNLPLYTTEIQKVGHTGTIPYEHFKTQIDNLTALAKLCRNIMTEAVDYFFHDTQIYVRHQPYDGIWPPAGPYTDYERIIDLIKTQPVLRRAKHVRWTVMLASDEGVINPHHHRHVNRTRIRFSPSPIRQYVPGVQYWIRDHLKDLETLHLDVNYRRDWLDLCAQSAWLYPVYLRVKKITLALNFAKADKYIEKARNSRYVRQGKPREMLEANILNHLLTLPEVCSFPQY